MTEHDLYHRWVAHERHEKHNCLTMMIVLMIISYLFGVLCR